MNPIALQRFEGFVFLVLALWLHTALGASWWIFALFVLVPDISMLAYLKNARWGALAYNAAHTYAAPILGFIAGYLLNEPYLMYGSVAWFAHIGADRLLGFGLKLPTDFKDTHLGRIGGR